MSSGILMAESPASRGVLPHMLSLIRDEFQILRSVVEPVAVLVVNHLTTAERSAEHFFHDESMDSDAPSVSCADLWVIRSPRPLCELVGD